MRTLLWAGLALVLSVPPRAEGQIGKITKKAQDAVTKAATPGQPGPAPKFDDVVIELKEDVLTRVVAGMRAARGVMGSDGVAPEEMLRRSAKASDQRAALMEGRDDDLQRYQESTNTQASCMNETVDRLQQEHSEEMQRRMMAPGGIDAQLIQDIQRLSMQQQERTAAGDTAGARKAQEDLMKRLGADPKADTAKAVTTCGRPPAKPAWLTQADSLNEESNRLLQEARELEQRRDTVGAQAAGLGGQQFAVAEERVEAFARSDGKPATVWAYSGAERTALGARLAELKELVD